MVLLNRSRPCGVRLIEEPKQPATRPENQIGRKRREHSNRNADGTSTTASMVGRGFAAAGVLLSADVHLFLYFDGYRDIKVIGPAFLLNAIGGIVIGIAVLVWHHWLPLLAAIAFGISTLGASTSRPPSGCSECTRPSVAIRSWSPR